MSYEACPLFLLQSKKELCRILSIKDKRMLKQDFITKLVEPYIDRTGKPRLIEPPQIVLKEIQSRIKEHLSRIDIPDNVFSGVKGRSYVENAIHHAGNMPRYLYKIDLTGFFPSINRGLVYRFFLQDMKCAPDIARILTDLTTIDLSRASMQNPDEVYSFLAEKQIKCFNHLISGAPSSQILSYLVNRKMFDEIERIAGKNSITMTIYVDDITFSSPYKMPGEFKSTVKSIVKKNGYSISRGKARSYRKKSPKLVTGVVIDAQGQIQIRNALSYKIITAFEYVKNNPDDIKRKEQLIGLITAARQVKKGAYPSIYRFVMRLNNEGVVKKDKSKADKPI